MELNGLLLANGNTKLEISWAPLNHILEGVVFLMPIGEF